MPDFLSLGIRPAFVDQLHKNGVTTPTPIQERSIPVLLKGKDLIAQAQTGTGKTLAFILPILEMVDPHQPEVQALIVTPTRELALQITAEVSKLARQLDGLNVLAVYGGQDVEQQMRKLQGKRQIVIATPGRLLDHLRRGTIRLSHVSMLVLDEADQMLHLGFLPEVQEIMEMTPTSRQTMLFSATMPQQIRTLAKTFLRTPEEIHVKSKQITVEEIKQLVVETTDRGKQAALRSMIDQHRPYLAIIFCRTKRRASTLNAALQEHGYQSDELHGDISQAKREDVMKRFREGKIQLLVATDVAARGLDVEGVTHVFNYDIPHDVESYIHRIGRTGRAGGKGLAITFVAPKDRQYLELIERGINLTIKKQRLEGNQSTPARSSQEGRSRSLPQTAKGKKQQQVKMSQVRKARKSGTRAKANRSR